VPGRPIGLLVAAFPFAMIIGFALAGRAVSGGHAQLVLVPSLVTVAGGAAGFVLGEGLAVYFPARFLMGLGSGGVWIGVTFMTLERWPGQEYLCMSRILSAYSAGGLIGPGLGAIGGVDGPFLAYLVLIGAGFALTLFMPAADRRRPFRTDRSALRVPGFWVAAAGVLFVYLGYGIVEGILPLHLADGLGQAQIGASYVGMSALVAVLAAIAGRLPPGPILFGSLGLVSVGIVIAGATNDAIIWLVALAVIGGGFGLGATGSVGVLLEAIPPERIVTAMVIWSQLGIIGYLIGPLAGGGVAETIGYAWLGVVPAVAGLGVVAIRLQTRRR
jgi:MFS family permease